MRLPFLFAFYFGAAATGVTTLHADAGSVAVTGTPVTFSVTEHQEPGAAISMAARSVPLRRRVAQHILTCGSGRVRITGSPITFSVTRSLLAEPISIAIAGADAALRLRARLETDRGSVVTDGASVQFRVSIYVAPPVVRASLAPPQRRRPARTVQTHAHAIVKTPTDDRIDREWLALQQDDEELLLLGIWDR